MLFYFGDTATLTKVCCKVTMRNWSPQSKIYLIFTSYKLVRNGEVCRGQ